MLEDSLLDSNQPESNLRWKLTALRLTSRVVQYTTRAMCLSPPCSAQDIAARRAKAHSFTAQRLAGTPGPQKASWTPGMRNTG